MSHEDIKTICDAATLIASLFVFGWTMQTFFGPRKRK